MAESLVVLNASEIPIIDLGPYFSGRPGALEATAAQLRTALESLGLVLLVQHGVPQDLIAATFAAAREFHTQPVTAKQALARNAAGNGYAAYCNPTNKNEAWYGTRNTPGAPNVWPDLPRFRETIEAYLKAVEALHHRLRIVLAVARELPADGLATALAAPMMLLRMAHYPAVQAEQRQFGVEAHEDQSFWTFLPASDVPGLQVRWPSGVWVDVPVVPGSFSVIVGPVLRYWTHDTYHALVHRVVAPVGRSRHALSCFLLPSEAALPYFMAP